MSSIGSENLNSVLNGIGKSENYVLNRVRVLTPGPHLPTEASVEHPPRDIGPHQSGEYGTCESFFSASSVYAWVTVRLTCHMLALCLCLCLCLCSCLRR